VTRAVVVVGALLLSSCALDAPQTAAPSLDENFFRCRVEPVLAESCAFYACHGAAERPFRVYAPNRLRLAVPEARRAIALTDAEHEHNQRAAESFARSSDGYDEPLLIEKPLDVALGGAFHRGAEDYGGGDVIVDPDDPALAALRAWVDGATEEDACAP